LRPAAHQLPPEREHNLGRPVKASVPGVAVSRDNVIPFRKRPPSERELDVYRQMTRGWSAALRERMFPEHFRRDQQRDPQSRK
jgi:hypothetical protein